MIGLLAIWTAIWLIDNREFDLVLFIACVAYLAATSRRAPQ